jgi:hypothetical protein
MRIAISCGASAAVLSAGMLADDQTKRMKKCL